MRGSKGEQSPHPVAFLPHGPTGPGPRAPRFWGPRAKIFYNSKFLKRYYVLKIASNAIKTLSEYLIFKIFLGEDPQTPQGCPQFLFVNNIL